MEPLTSSSKATLIRSGGLFFTSAALRMASVDNARACSGSNATPTRSRTMRRWSSALRSDPGSGAVPSGSPRPRRRCSTTVRGTWSRPGKYPRRWKHFIGSSDVSVGALSC